MCTIAFNSALPIAWRALGKPLACRTSVLRTAAFRTRTFAKMAAPATLDAPAPSVAGPMPVFAQTMLRVQDAKASIAFYESVGLQYLTSIDFPEYKFSLYFLAAPDATTPPVPGKDAPRAERGKYLWSLRCPTLELTHNWPGGDAESYVSGNEEPRGYCHLALAGARAPGSTSGEPGAAAVTVAELPGESGDVVCDPDGYAVKLVGEPRGEGIVYARTMLRVGDPVRSVRFFERLGMRRLCRIDSDGASHIFLAYADADTGTPAASATPDECGVWLANFGAPVVHLRHDWEKPEEKLVNGNEKPHRGFGHLGIIVDDIYAVTARMEEFGYGVVRKPSPFLDVGELSFVKDDDVGYWVELIGRTGNAGGNAYMKQ